jgi:hypothetical protein
VRTNPWFVPHNLRCPTIDVRIYKLVNGKDDIPYMTWKIKFMFQTTNQIYLRMSHKICQRSCVRMCQSQNTCCQSTCQNTRQNTCQRIRHTKFIICPNKLIKLHVRVDVRKYVTWCQKICHMKLVTIKCQAAFLNWCAFSIWPEIRATSNLPKHISEYMSEYMSHEICQIRWLYWHILTIYQS